MLNYFGVLRFQSFFCKRALITYAITTQHKGVVMTRVLKYMGMVVCIAALCGVLVGCSQASSKAAVAAENGVAAVDLAFIKANLESSKLVDARIFDDYAGDLPGTTERDGHIPGAVSVPVETLLDKEGNPIESSRSLRKFKHENLEVSDAIVVYGEGAEDAQVVANLLKENGYTNVSVFEAGFASWANDGSNEVEKAPPSCCRVPAAS